jgi:hypothetical protein
VLVSGLVAAAAWQAGHTAAYWTLGTRDPPFGPSVTGQQYSDLVGSQAAQLQLHTAEQQLLTFNSEDGTVL